MLFIRLNFFFINIDFFSLINGLVKGAKLSGTG